MQGGGKGRGKAGVHFFRSSGNMQRDDRTHLGDEFLIKLDLARVEVNPVQGLDRDRRPLRRRGGHLHLFPLRGSLLLLNILLVETAFASVVSADVSWSL